MNLKPSIPTETEIRQARERIAVTATRTALARFEPPAGGAVFLKLENTQPIGSFKIRGAANAMGVASAAELAAGVWTASAGNMAQGVAWVARERGVRCRVVVPEHAPRAKTDAAAALGAELVTVSFEAWWKAMLTRAHPGMSGLMIHPFSDTHVMAGNATIGLEVAEDQPDLDAVLVPWGGGGLACGIAAALRNCSPRTKVYAVEVDTAAPLTASFAAGRPVVAPRTKTFVDGMGSDRIADEMWPLATELIAGTIVVTVPQVAAALKLLVESAGVTAEGAGAATVAAALGGQHHAAPGTRSGAGPARDARIACIISGGRIDPGVVAAILRGEIPE